MNGDLMLLGKLLREVQLITRNGVDSVWSHTPADSLRELRKELLIAVAIVAIQLCPLGIATVKERVAQISPYACLQHRTSGRLRRCVHIEEAGRTALDHLHTAEQSTDIDILFRHVRLHGPDVILQPRLQRQVIAIPSEERHGTVCVSVAESWHDRLVTAVEDDRIFIDREQVRTDLVDTIVHDQEILRRTSYERLLN